MPLPESTIALAPSTNPGETEPTKPKVAMLVRLSSATIDALTSLAENKRDMDFEFGKTPGIHIDGTFYPMRMQKEETPHEIYLRTTLKNGAGPLKLYANVTEKLFIEYNEIGDDLTDKIRTQTLKAAKQRDDRKTIFMETPPAPPVKITQKQKKEQTMFRNVRPPNAKLNTSAPPANHVPLPAPPPKKKKLADPALRNRLIHCIATQERTRDEILKLVSGGDASARRDVIDLLEEVAEPTSALKKGEDPGSQTMTLKDQAWLDVRPMEWPNLTEKARTQLKRTGRLKLKAMGYKDTDPEWAPFLYRSTDTTSSVTSAGPSRTAEIQQRGKLDGPSKTGLMSTKDVKKPKPQSDPNAEIRMKDESAKAAPSASGKMKEVVASNSPALSASRKLPGSGFKASKSTTPISNTNTDALAHTSVPRNKPLENDIKPPRPSLPPKVMPSAVTAPQKVTTTSSAAIQRVKKARESDVNLGLEAERDRAAKSTPVVKQGGPEKRVTDVQSLKRRPRDDYDSDASTSLASVQKKRRMDNGTPSTLPSTKNAHPRDLSLPKKPEVAPPPPPARQKNKEPSPLPPPPPLPKINKRTNPSSRPSTSLHESKMSPPESTSSTQSPRDSRARGELKGSVKRRRGSPIYTSSSDEDGDNRNVKARRQPSKVQSPAPPVVNGNGRVASQARPRVHEPKPLPTDHASLRLRYTTTYSECMAALTTLLAQKSRIDNMLRNGDGSVTDSDGDAEIMDQEDLKKLSFEYERLHGELEVIRQRFAPEPV